MELHDWSLCVWELQDIYLCGYIYKDENERFNDGTRVETSTLKSIDFEKGIAHTQNSTYILK